MIRTIFVSCSASTPGVTAVPGIWLNEMRTVFASRPGRPSEWPIIPPPGMLSWTPFASGFSGTARQPGRIPGAWLGVMTAWS